jgi:hypothetical protein
MIDEVVALDPGERDGEVGLVELGRARFRAAAPAISNMSV